MGFQPGDAIGRFTLIELVARGASGDVYQAKDNEADDLVALKIFRELTADEPGEIDVTQAVLHDNLVRYVDHGTSSERFWLATEWVQGRTLAHLLATEGPLSMERAARLVGQLAAAVDELHANNIVHGDLSPSNMVVDLHDRLVVLDLGAAARPAQAIDQTIDVPVATTPRYAAPEVALGQAPGPASDRYAIAVIAYEALTGTTPYPPVETPIAALGHHASTAPTPPTEQRPTLPPHVDDVLLTALAKSPSDRYSSAQDFAVALDSHSHTNASGYPRRRVLLAALGLAIIALIATVAALVTRPSSPASSATSVTAEPGVAGWKAGDAAGFTCNLIEVPGFEQDSITNYFNADPQATVQLVPGAGVEGSRAARVGSTGQYSLFAELIPVQGDTDYVLSSWVRRQGQPVETGVYINFLDSDFGELTDTIELLPPQDELGDADGARTAIVTTSPPGAAWAIPTFFKDSSGGSLFIDEVVFGESSRCGEGLTS